MRTACDADNNLHGMLIDAENPRVIDRLVRDAGLIWALLDKLWKHDVDWLS